ncbi:MULTISPECIES: ATP-binding protein [Bradyrhizobium]|uniref:ATP-binding protein n=1 Tax=Bradyrhizobium TaxID=374 RepID=UPI00155F0E4B|nr:MULTISPECIES: ATP-binding protein [Bradyrhizobium]MDD1519681.1 hybrid sensor histidine kinase/response regulator [Bradyrhizobium sp. WBAH30]MDD1543925.1 hybrid sensor histidine kinase/response regulator [Bradyrhizobium sp. WBAH41]MDD1557790.1 hybrid sensor histidine kinase/response regulator [Bradyrhizobium sp. WBAH23]MDD1565203.1 hybrid sensor histidine kinase/response regulator [Bradyrhizobium sp. WBAH33]MDD1592306.1 hybrid sensor histidine kinase/response regulator [Bradyrhizobium sp. WB
MAAKTRPVRTTRTSRRRPLRKRAGPARRVRKRGTKAVAPDVVQAALAAFAHEVRTPLTGILAISDLLATSDLGERERRWADTIKAGAEHLASLATLFVDAAKTGKGGSTPRQDLFDLKTLARTAGDSLAGRAAAKGLQAKVAIADKIPALVVGDSVRLRAALENLIDNAVKFTDQGGVALAVEPWRPAKGKAKGKGRVGVAFAVSDSGIGLTMAEIKRLFRPFTQANVTIASRFGGAGLGLSSVKQLARAMGGDITVAPRRGGGATFTLTVSLDAAGPGKTRKAKDGSEPEAVAALRVLSVEDNPFGRVVLNTILTELGHHAEFIGRGEDAVKRLEQGAFDAVLMDMVLPGIDGIEAIRRIRKLPTPLAQIPIIGVSGRGEDEAASREAGADAFLVKPVSPRALATALLEATRREEAAT